MRIVRKPLTVSPVADGVYNLTWTPPKGAYLGAIGLSVDKQAALVDTQVTGISHGKQQAVKGNVNGSTTYYPALGQIACCVEHKDLDTVSLVERKFQAWPGRYNSSRDLTYLQYKLSQGESLSYPEKLRVRFAGRIPCEGFAFWQLRQNVEFRVDLTRIYGASTITKAYLHVLEFDSKAEFDLFCGQPDLTDHPVWICQPLILAAAAAVDATELETLWPADYTGINPHAVRIRQLFAVGYENNGGTIAYNPLYANAVLIKSLLHDGDGLAPFYADDRVSLAEVAPQLLQHFDCARDPALLLKWHSSLRWQTERLVTTYQKDIRLTLYGLLRPQDANGDVRDAA